MAALIQEYGPEQDSFQPTEANAFREIRGESDPLQAVLDALREEDLSQVRYPLAELDLSEARLPAPKPAPRGVCTPAQLYAGPFQGEPSLRLSSCNLAAHLPEVPGLDYLPDWPAYQPGDQEPPNQRVWIKLVRSVNYDDRRNWILATVWLDDQPFMTIQNAGREARDFQRRFITDAEVFKQAVIYLTELVITQQMEELRREDFSEELVSPDHPVEELSWFYGDGFDPAELDD